MAGMVYFDMIRFPKEFLWGAATSAHQVEGNNSGSDWWEWERLTGRERSGEACRHYELYERDFDLVKDLRHNAHRFSIEWARIEPEEGKFDPAALKHYLDVVSALRTRGIEPVATLHHFTNPSWFARDGGWENEKSSARFSCYCAFVVRALAGSVRYWITINEPSIYVSHSYLFGVWPPQKKSLWGTIKAEKNMIRAHLKAYRVIHGIYREAGIPKPAVSIAHHMIAVVPCKKNPKSRLAARLRRKIFNERYLDTLKRHQALDFIGVNYYSRQLADPRGWGPRSLVADICRENHHPVKKNALGWDIYPEGLYDILYRLAKYRLPVLIAENGICTNDDRERWEFLREHLKSVHRAMEDGLEVIGYLHWSLMDNFEWDKGFAPRFGLVEIDYGTQTRKIRESAKRYAEVCETGILA
ncbi:MAG: Beta-glucosidase A [Candidatus Omnitrophica bacterium ADurb.Bin277]|nr:MAG: Beta-glucosidase A [Candidatus Omnitrophica bacterium ADurb.Bin277]